MLIHPEPAASFSLPWRSLLIDCEKDPTLRAVLVGMLREDERNA
jgi:hypothetical protein